MSIGGEIMEEHYDKLIREFLLELEAMRGNVPISDGALMLFMIIKKYREYFKNNGIYD